MSRNDTAPNRGNDGENSDTTTSDDEPAEAFIATELTAGYAAPSITTEATGGNVSVIITAGGDGTTVSRLILEPDRADALADELAAAATDGRRAGVERGRE